MLCGGLGWCCCLVAFAGRERIRQPALSFVHDSCSIGLVAPLVYLAAMPFLRDMLHASFAVKSGGYPLLFRDVSRVRKHPQRSAVAEVARSSSPSICCSLTGATYAPHRRFACR